VVAEEVVALGLRHAVVTSVTRDDLPDGGAGHFAETIRAIRSHAEATGIEVLIPDFQGSEQALQIITAARPDVINHNLETVPRLYPVLRKGADYARSLRLLKHVKELLPDMVTKSGIMVGAGERREEILELIRDLVSVGCSALTIGQYLQPTESHHPVDRYVPPEEFQDITEEAKAAGIRHVVGGPLVRSSYRAGETVDLLRSSCPNPDSAPEKPHEP
jgi:lipoic acid synthetase